MPDQSNAQNTGKKGSDEPRPRGLSPRMLQVLELRAQGKTHAEIATSLCISASTVKMRIGQAKARLRARSNLEAISFAIKAGLIHL